jgi:hypothetical protein
VLAAQYTNAETTFWSEKLGAGKWWRRGQEQPSDREITRAKQLEGAKVCSASSLSVASSRGCQMFMFRSHRPMPSGWRHCLYLGSPISFESFTTIPLFPPASARCPHCALIRPRKGISTQHPCCPTRADGSDSGYGCCVSRLASTKAGAVDAEMVATQSGRFWRC